MANVAFSICLIASYTVLQGTFLWPVGVFLAGGGVIWYAGEIIYAVTSTCSGYGDFGSIRKISIPHLVISTAILIAPIAIGILL